MDDLRVLVLYYIMEGALLGFVGMALIGVRLAPKKAVQVGILQGLIVYFVRGIYNIFDITPGSHVFVTMVCLVVVFRIITSKPWALCSVAALLAFITLLVSEGLMIPVLLTFLGLTFEQVASSPWLHIAIGYCSNWLVIAVAVYLGVTKKSLFNFEGILNSH